MFPKLLKNAKLEDVQKENPAIMDLIKAQLTAELTESISATLQVTHKEILSAMEGRVGELETQCAIIGAENKILKTGIANGQSELAIKLIAEGKTEIDALAEIEKAKTSLENFSASAPVPAGNGSSSDVQSVDTQAKAIEAVLQKHPEFSHAKAIHAARREYSHLFVNPNLTNHTEKR